MSKIHLIIQREYTTRVMKRSFLLLTFLTPLFFAAMIIVPIWMSTLKDEKEKHILVIDQTHRYSNALKSNNTYIFDFIDQPLDEVRETHKKDKKITAILVIADDLLKNPAAATLYSEEQVNLETKSYIEGLLNEFLREQKLASYNIPDLDKIIQESNSKINISTIRWDEQGKEKQSSAELALIIGMISAFIIYMFILTYGSQVMSGVIQEKTNRVVEIIVSSVKPFELMLGKIIGIALVGLTQFFLWIILTFVLLFVAQFFFSNQIDMSMLQQTNQMAAIPAASMENVGNANNMLTVIQSFDFVQIGIYFLIYFLGGYLLYASLFAAVGSAVDNETDTQQFSFPLTLPIIFALFVAIYGAQNPDSSLAFWCSLIPFTSPVVMMVRLPYGVAAWEIVLSLFILILSFIATTWVAGKIYRTGILMYGKKPSWKELWKWLKY